MCVHHCGVCVPSLAVVVVGSSVVHYISRSKEVPDPLAILTMGYKVTEYR